MRDQVMFNSEESSQGRGARSPAHQPVEGSQTALECSYFKYGARVCTLVYVCISKELLRVINHFWERLLARSAAFLWATEQSSHCSSFSLQGYGAQWRHKISEIDHLPTKDNYYKISGNSDHPPTNDDYFTLYLIEPTPGLSLVFLFFSSWQQIHKVKEPWKHHLERQKRLRQLWPHKCLGLDWHGAAKTWSERRCCPAATEAQHVSRLRTSAKNAAESRLGFTYGHHCAAHMVSEVVSERRHQLSLSKLGARLATAKRGEST